MVWRPFVLQESASLQRRRVMLGGPRIGDRTLHLVDAQSVEGHQTSHGKGHIHTRNPPRGYYLDVGLETVKGKLKPDLIVSFPRAAMGYEAEKWKLRVEAS